MKSSLPQLRISDFSECQELFKMYQNRYDKLGLNRDVSFVVVTVISFTPFSYDNLCRKHHLCFICLVSLFR